MVGCDPSRGVGRGRPKGEGRIPESSRRANGLVLGLRRMSSIEKSTCLRPSSLPERGGLAGLRRELRGGPEVMVEAEIGYRAECNWWAFAMSGRMSKLRSGRGSKTPSSHNLCDYLWDTRATVPSPAWLNSTNRLLR